MDNRGQLSPSVTTDLLRKIGHDPVRKLGQNFLVDSNIVRKSLELAEVANGDVVIEVGTGLGTLTGALLGAGAKVFAVELDKRLFAFISAKFKDDKNFNIINADAIDFPLAALPEDISNFKIVANLPYAISTPWLDKILSGKLPAKMSLMLQKEAALRFSAKTDSGDYSPISVFLSECFEVSGMHKVSSSCFHPRPKVDSVLLALKRKENPYVFDKRTKDIMRRIFSKRRKQIASIVKSSGDDCAVLAKWLEMSGIDRKRRPETIENDIWKILNSIVIAQ